MELEEYIKLLGGDKIINKILIANNGIAAVKAIRSVRKWAYSNFGNERIIKFVVMATPEDMKANAEYIRMADQILQVPGGSNNNNYANVDIIVDFAERAQVQAVWAGWGHASENPRLPDLLSKTKTGIVFIGPPANAMQDLGDKIASTIVAQSARVACVPWSGSGLTVDYSKSGEIPQDIYRKACVTSVEECKAVAERVGFPAMIKASEGGGGKGIRKVLSMEDLPSSFRQVQSEVPGSPIFFMKLVPNARHLEVQIVADRHGEAISLNGRDCSVQRRHQKIIEEGPAIAPTPQVWEEMEKAAVRLVKEVGYVGAGTVEYLFADNQYFFLELNPRLQVEHPVTEEITGVNLPATQLQIAMGIPLHRIPDIRKLYKQNDLFGDNKIDLENFENRLKPKGHCIAVRITGENPDEGFKPTSGQIHELTFRSTPNIWGYFSVGAKGGIHEYADSQFGHIFASGTTREEARKTIILGLKEISIRGDIRTPVEYIIHLLETEAFKNNEIHTGWLDVLISEKIQTKKPNTDVVVLCGALYKASTIFQTRVQEFTNQVTFGQLPSLELLQNIVPVELIYNNIKYQFDVSRTGPNSFSVHLKNDRSVIIDSTIISLSDSGLLILLDGVTHVCYGREDVTGLSLIIDSKTCVFSEEYDPSILRTSSPGKLVRYLVDDGSLVTKGTPFAEIEVMKMYMPLLVPEKGTIRFVLSEGSVMPPGAIIANLDLQDTTSIQKSTIYQGSLTKMSPPTLIGEKPHQVLASTLSNFKNVFCGYESNNLVQLVDDTFKQLINPELPIYEFKEALSNIQSRIPQPLVALINQELDQPVETFNSKHLQLSISLFLNKLLLENEQSSIATSNNVKPIKDLTDKYFDGVKYASINIIKSFLEEFIQVEISLQNKNIQTVLKSVRSSYKDNVSKVVDIAQSLHPQSKKYKLILIILDKILSEGLVGEFIDQLKKLSVLGGQSMEISLKSKHIMVRAQLPSNKQRSNDLKESLVSILNSTTDSLNEDPNEDRDKKISILSKQTNEISDILIPFFNNQPDDIRRLAMEVYVRHSYRSYYVEDTKVTLSNENELFSFIEWHFYISLPSSSSSPTYGSPLVRSSGGGFPSPRPSAIFNGLSMLRTDSTDSLTAMEDVSKRRYGMMVYFEDEKKFEEKLPFILKRYNEENKSKQLNLGQQQQEESTDILSVILSCYPDSISQENQAINSFTMILKNYIKDLSNARIRRITFICSSEGKPLKYFTFRERHLYNEDPIFRHIEPAMAYHLEVRKLSNFDITHVPTQSQRIHLYYAQEKGKRETDPDADRCFFVRSVIRYSDLYGHSNEIKVDILLSQIETLLSESIEALEMAVSNKKYEKAQNHRIFLNIMPEVMFDEKMIGYVVQEIGDRLGKKLWKLRVGGVEVRGRIRKENNLIPVRFFIQNPTGYAFQVQCYYEQQNSIGQTVFAVVPGSARGIWEGLPIDTPYPIMDAVQRNRFKAQRLDTTYVYDYPDLFREALQNIWMEYMEINKENPVKVYPSSRGVLECVELILSPGAFTDYPPSVPIDQIPDSDESKPKLEETYRPVGYNDIGMVAWRMTFYTPEYPLGRQAIVIANDITHQIGSFGPQEDLLFKLASELARKEKIPRIYLSSNSGARIGLADEIKNRFKVAWNNENDPTKGIKHLYLCDSDYQQYSNSVKAYQDPNDSEKWIITDIIGQKNGIGVENLSWSGLIAGETSQAYNEIFTITLVSGRSVGIGAYLVRLGQRTIQNDAPIILTGASALNKVLGKEVYESNQQLGGSQIMYPNGVSHIVVNDELRGITNILQWLSFVPKNVGELVPIISSIDPPERDIDFDPSKAINGKCDTRHLISGFYSELDSTQWISGMFDKDSFMETLGGWANTVITGRARLGGIPVGIIAVETKSVEKIIPADPANPLSTEQVTTQAGQVWYPDSSFKTAQAIADFNNGEQLPLMIIANWRGFSGGMRDMFDEILKFGSMIVDNLRNYRQPVMVYIPPCGELRGGAWVVLDSTINLDMMEMYSAEEGRGGVLEPNGIVEIKYRDPELIKTMHRLDSKLIEWDKQIPIGVSLNGLDQQQKSIKLQIQQREKELLGLYQQIAIKFADFHDTPGRMKAKGVIHQVVPWKFARKFFYNRLKRRLLEEQQLNSISKSNPKLNRQQRLNLLENWLKEIYIQQKDQHNLSENQKLNQFISPPSFDYKNDDKVISSIIESSLSLLSDKTNNLSKNHIENQFLEIIQSNSEILIDNFKNIIPLISNQQKNHLINLLSNNLNNNN
ncbi:acetyl-CoA carboxylase [Dictyostelium purpureum]|uniref:Acetyl-CoA carboxylase n=1 Tax=Dictyostelium purpureum TaxID=5786 RepID=F1A0W2_DICPU|nr:acetyl-CoA carboxylase [Dictyostelium purpureum]EGC30161.1 acetyl-CoA carboxylase [Dictyostelium purpureum]|eukprot:XP_003293306.1 acetyl-CoA carboxylase [Dictyostelium purpureum]